MSATIPNCRVFSVLRLFGQALSPVRWFSPSPDPLLPNRSYFRRRFLLSAYGSFSCRSPFNRLPLRTYRFVLSPLPVLCTNPAELSVPSYVSKVISTFFVLHRPFGAFYQTPAPNTYRTCFNHIVLIYINTPPVFYSRSSSVFSFNSHTVNTVKCQCRFYNFFFILLLTVILLLSDTHNRALYFAVPFQYAARARHCFIVRTVRYPSSPCSAVKLTPDTIITESLRDRYSLSTRFPGGKNILSQRRLLYRANFKIGD